MSGMNSRQSGRRNGLYAKVPKRLARSCPRCEAKVGRRCVKKVGDQWLPMADTHAERRAGKDPS